MNDPSTLASLSWSELTSAPAWQGLDVVGRAQVVNEYYGALGNSLTGTDRDTVENRDKLNARRRERLYEVAPLLRQPEDIGTMENVSNAFTKSLNSFHENIALNLIQQNPEEARRFHASLEAQYPTREGFGETLGRVTGMMLPTGAALLSAPVTGPIGMTGAASLAAGAIYGATSAGSALGDIYAYEQATGDDVSSGKTAAVMAGHAIFEMATEMAGFHFLLGGARRIGQNLTESTAETVGRHLLNNERRQLARASADAMADFFTYNKKAAFALGWAKMGLIEGVEEASSQIMQNVTDKLYRESGTLDGMLATFKEGALGGLLLGPLAFGMQASAYTAQKDRMAMAGVDILDDALKVQARREAGAGANEQVIADIYTSLRNEYDAESPIDRAALDNPTFMFLKEYFGMTGTETLPVRDSGAGKGKGALLTAADGTPIILIDTALLDKGFDGIFAFVAGHEFKHAMDKILGPEKSVTLAREIAASVPEFAKYRTTLESAHAAVKLAAPSETYTQNEAVADIFGQVFFKPQFLGAAIDAAVKNPAIGREVVRTLKDMRSRFERMGRRIDAQMEYTRTAWAEAKAADEARGDGQMTEQDKLEAAGVPILRLPRAAMEIAKAKIDGDVTALDRMTVQFVKSFETSLARQAEPAKAKVVGGTEPPEDLLGRAIPVPVPPAASPVQSPVNPVQPASGATSGATTALTPDAEQLLVAAEQGVPAFITNNMRAVAAKNGVTVTDTMTPADVVAALRAKRQPAPAPESAPLSIKETPDEIFNRAFDKDATAFRASDEAKVLEDVWGSMKPTSYVLNEMFLKRRRYVLPERIAAKVRGQQTLSNAEKLLLRNFNELPDWVKLRNRDNPGSVKVMEWSPDAIDGMSLLGTGGLNATETATGFLRENGLDPSGGWQMQVAVGDVTVTDENRMRPASDDGGTTNADHVLEALHANIKGYKTKGDFRRAVAAMMQTELKPHLDDLARRRVSKDIDARRITQRLKRMYDVVKPGTINRIVNEPTMNVTESLVSRDDLKVDDVIRQKDNLFVVDGFNPDRSPIVTPLRASAPFDTTPGAVDDPMADPELAKDYRFGMELPPVTPFYSVQAVFPLDMSVDAQDMAEEARAARPEEEVPFSIKEPLVGKKINVKPIYHGTPEGGFESFRTDRPVFATDSKAIAEGYTQKRGIWLSAGKSPEVMALNLFAENPLEIDAVGARNNNIPFPGQEWKPTVFGNLPKNAVSVSEAAQRAFEAGHDALIVRNVKDSADKGTRTNSTVYVVKSASQVQRIPAEGAPRSVREMPDDAAYMKAVEAGDMATAQRMVDEAAKAAGLTDKFAHGTDAEVMAGEFKTGVRDPGWFGAGAYLTSYNSYAKRWGKKLYAFFVPPGRYAHISVRDKYRSVTYLAEANEAHEAAGGTEGAIEDRKEYADRFSRYLRDAGFAGVKVNMDGYADVEVVVFDPSQIKSAAPVTRDDQGNVIPLSQRFNPQDNDIRRSIREVDSDLNFQRNYLRADTSFAPMEQAAKAILDANGAATHSEKLANLSKHKFIGREGDGTRAFAYDNLKKAGLEQLENKDKAAAATYFGTPDERVWLAKIREAEKQSVAHASMQGLTLGVYSFIAKRNAIANPFARGTFYMGMFRDIAGGMSKEDITNLDLWQDAIMESRKDAAEDVRDELLRMGREEFERALVSHHAKLRTDWLREQFAKRKTTAPLSVKEEAGDLLDQVFGPDFAKYYRRLKDMAMGAAFQKELADAYGADNVALIVEQMEGHAAMFPGEITGPAAPKVKTPAAQAAEVLLAKAEEKYRKKLDQAIANDFKGELQAYYAQKINRALPSLSLTAAARGAAMTPAERAKAIDVAFTTLAKEVYAERLADRGGRTTLLTKNLDGTPAPAGGRVPSGKELAAMRRPSGGELAAAGVLTLEGVARDLEGIKAILKEREVAFTALSSALAAAMRDANVTMADVLKASNETFGYVKTRLADDVKARVAEQLAKTVGMEEFPDAIDEAAARAGRAVEQMLETRLTDWIEDGNNVPMRENNASRRAARTLVDVLSGANAPEMTAKPYSATSKGLAATLLGDATMFKNALAATLQAAQTKAESLGQDIITPMAQALGLPATATLADIEAAVLSTRLPPAAARRVVEEHLASTGRTVLGLLEPLAHLEPGLVADELAAEFGADTKPLWEAALTKLMSDRSAAIVKRLGKKRDAAPARRKDLLDTLLFAAATGQFDDASLMEHVSKAAGLPVLSEAARTQLKALVEDELKAIRETGDPDSSFVQPFTVKIARLLAGEAVRHWRAEGKKAGIFRFSKIDRDRLVAAFYASALSGPRTWLVTNPVGSTLKTLATLLELSAKNAMLDRTLKKQGFRGALKAWSYMLKAANIDGIKAAIKDDMSPGRIRRRFEFGSAMAASSIDNPDPETRLFGAGPGLWGKIERFTYGIAQKYVPRLIRAGDVGPFNMAADFGSYEAARKAALETNPDLTVEQADLEAKRILGYTSDGQIRPEFLAQAREEAARLFGGQVEEYKIRNRAREIATAQRPDYVQRVGDFIGGEGTFTSDAGIRYVETPGMDPARGANWLSGTENYLSDLKNSENAAIALGTTAVFPFTKIALRVFDASLNYTLVPGIWRWKELQGKAAQDSITPEMQKSYEEAADLALTRMVHGTLVTIAAMLLAAASRDDDPWIEITGAGPSDFKKNWQWREAGGRPFTITLPGGIQVDYRTSPFFSILAAAGAWADQKHLSEDDRSNAVVAYGAGFFKSTLNQSFMSSASDLLGAITEADTEAGRQKLVSLFVNPVTTALVPASGLIRQVEEQFLPYPNVGRASGSAMETFLSTAISRIPMLNGFLPRKINALGRDVEGDRPTEVALGIQDWKRGSDEQAARVFDFSVAKRAWISVPNAIRTFVLPPDTALSKAEARRLADKDQALMTFAEYTAFMQRRGDIIVETFNKYEGELYKIEAGDKAAKVMDEIVSAAQDQAKRELLGLRPIKPGAVPADRKIRAAIRDAMAE